MLKGSHAQFCPHMLSHLKALYAAVKAVEDCGQVKLFAGTCDLCDVCKHFFIGF